MENRCPIRFDIVFDVPLGEPGDRTAYLKELSAIYEEVREKLEKCAKLAEGEYPITDGKKITVRVEGLVGW